MDHDTRTLKQRQLATLKARDQLDDEAAAAVARLEAELAGVDQVDLRDAHLRGAVEAAAELRIQLAAEKAAHAQTRAQFDELDAVHRKAIGMKPKPKRAAK